MYHRPRRMSSAIVTLTLTHAQWVWKPLYMLQQLTVTNQVANEPRIGRETTCFSWSDSLVLSLTTNLPRAGLLVSLPKSMEPSPNGAQVVDGATKFSVHFSAAIPASGAGSQRVSILEAGATRVSLLSTVGAWRTSISHPSSANHLEPPKARK